jgi:predicted nucleic acid-binding protein
LDFVFITTYQVINEVSNILLKKNYTEIEIRETVDYLFKVCTLQEFTKEILLTASFIREKYTFSF